MQVYQVVIVFLVAFVVTYAMVPVAKKLADVLGAIDYPGNRRINTTPIPRCGGVALYVGLCAGVFTIVLGANVFDWEVTNLYVMSGVDFRLLFVGVSCMFGVGLVDDIISLKSFPKLVGQIGAATIIALSGTTIGSVRLLGATTYFAFGWLDIPVTVLYLIVFVNITNLIDGLDGLAAGLIAIVSASLVYMLVLRGAFTMALLTVALVAACLAFLRFNFFPASIFMGDSGSHLLGVLVGVISITGVVRAQGIVTMLVPLVLAGVPVLDTCSAIIRRLRSHEPVGKGDADHIHHKLLRSGLGQRRTVAVLWVCTATLAVAGVAIENLSSGVRLAIIIMLIVVLFAVIWKFGLFKPVLKHHYDSANKGGVRTSSGIREVADDEAAVGGDITSKGAAIANAEAFGPKAGE